MASALRGSGLAVYAVELPGHDLAAENEPFASMAKVVEQVAAEIDPGAIVVPRVIAGFTDAHYFRDLGIVSYGFVPRWLPPQESHGIHGPNERIAIQNLERGVRAFVRILETLGRPSAEPKP